jgi:hypothetical protein
VSPAGYNSCTAKQRVEQREGKQSQVDRCRHSPTANNMKRATYPLTAHQFPAAYSLEIYRRHPDTTVYGNCALPRLDASTAGSVELAVGLFGAECGNNSVSFRGLNSPADRQAFGALQNGPGRAASLESLIGSGRSSRPGCLLGPARARNQ